MTDITLCAEPQAKPSAVLGAQLPPQLRALFITGPRRTGGWIADAFASDSTSEVVLEETDDAATGLARLRDDVYDAVLISHEPGDLDALELLDAVRTGSSQHQPIIVLGQMSEQELCVPCFEAGADAYLCVNTATTRSLLWTAARAIERHQLRDENRRLQQADRHRLKKEHDEAARLLSQQRAMIADLEDIRSEPTADTTADLNGDASLAHSPQLVAHYRELLRTYVIMGTGNLAAELQQLAELLAADSVSAQQAMLLHLHVLEELVQGLGSRSARHVMNRADLLIMEVMVNLADDYRRRLRDVVHPPRQKSLPSF